jgi:hypothetical protein
MSRTHISVSEATHAKLKIVQASEGLRSADAAVAHLLSHFEDRAEEFREDDSGVSGGDEPVGRRKVDVREPLYTLEILAERRGMLEYYTGFDLPTIELLAKRIREVCTRRRLSRSPSCSSVRRLYAFC